VIAITAPPWAQAAAAGAALAGVSVGLAGRRLDTPDGLPPRHHSTLALIAIAAVAAPLAATLPHKILVIPWAFALGAGAVLLTTARIRRQRSARSAQVS
jgi:hypothetical protein